jgi:hypothetical protein
LPRTVSRDYNRIIKSRTNARGFLKLVIIGLAVTCSALISSGMTTAFRFSTVLQASQSAKETDKQSKVRNLKWSPPQVDAPLGSRLSSTACVLPDLLELAGSRANELYTNLQSFSAQEFIEFESLDHTGYPLDARQGTFDYVVLYHAGSGGTTAQESRQPKPGSTLLPIFSQELGLPEMGLMFLPELQEEYDMRCEGSTEWNGQYTYVIHFVHRKDKRSHTLSFGDSHGGAHAAKLKGRAWIAAATGEVLHLEFALLQEMPEVKIREWYLSMNYAPVQFQTHSARMVLPQTVVAYYNFVDHRTIIDHTFSDFLLFSIQTDQKTAKPKNP